jgi:uncharacterized membrane protein
MLAAMNSFSRLLSQHPLIFVHLVAALAAIAIGAVLLWRRKGTVSHRALGWAWVAMMGTAAVTSAFIGSHAKLSVAGFSPIHLLTILVLTQLPRGVWHARQGRIEAHRKTMRGLYIGGCAVAGLFALLPWRFLGRQLWQTMA